MLDIVGVFLFVSQTLMLLFKHAISVESSFSVVKSSWEKYVEKEGWLFNAILRGLFLFDSFCW